MKDILLFPDARKAMFCLHSSLSTCCMLLFEYQWKIFSVIAILMNSK